MDAASLSKYADGTWLYLKLPIGLRERGLRMDQVVDTLLASSMFP